MRILFGTLLLLAATAAPASAQPPPAATLPTPAAPTQPVGTISELMVQIIYPASDAIFYITTREPKSEAAWVELQGKALAVAESANLLMMPGRARDQDRWMQDAKLMLDAGRAAFRAAKAKDVAALAALNDQLYTSCTTCHQHYRPNYGRRPPVAAIAPAPRTDPPQAAPQSSAADASPADTSAAASPAEKPSADVSSGGAKTLLPHPADSRWWLSGQANFISQMHGAFPSPYQGPNSLRPEREQALSRAWTIYTGVKLPGRTELLFDVESAGGRGLSDALGLAGFTNLDVVRNPTLGAAPYVARAMVHTTIALSATEIEATPTAFALAARVPERRLEIYVGKLGMADFFDVNASGSDSHLQFTNWTVDNNGAYDYAADTRGYTYAAMAEYITPRWTVRFGEALMPTVANGVTMDWHISRSRAENLELELRPVTGLEVKLLGYANHANMGSYDEAIQAFLSGRDATPDIVAHRTQGTVKTGAGVNLAYAFPQLVRLFARSGWNEGHHESFAYTEVNDSVQAGGDLTGAPWRRARDRIGIAVVSNGLSAAHREYLALGGQGFLLGDGALSYGREDIVESYYTAHLWRGLSAAAGVQYIDHPGYNRDRGPVLVEMLRLHADF